MIYCFAWTIFYFIAGSVLAVASVSFHGAFGWAVAAFFAFCAMCVYALDCYLKFLAWKVLNSRFIVLSNVSVKNNEKARGGGVTYRPRQEDV